MDKPKIIKGRETKKYWLEGYLIYKINIYNEEIEEIKYYD